MRQKVFLNEISLCYPIKPLGPVMKLGLRHPRKKERCNKVGHQCPGLAVCRFNMYERSSKSFPGNIVTARQSRIPLRVGELVWSIAWDSSWLSRGVSTKETNQRFCWTCVNSVNYSNKHTVFGINNGSSLGHQSIMMNDSTCQWYEENFIHVWGIDNHNKCICNGTQADLYTLSDTPIHPYRGAPGQKDLAPWCDTSGNPHLFRSTNLKGNKIYCLSPITDSWIHIWGTHL